MSIPERGAPRARKLSAIGLPALDVARLPVSLRWAALVALSALVAAAWTLAGAPAPLLLGPMIAGVAFAVAGGAVSIPTPAFALAQGVLGCLIARTLPSSIFGAVAANLPIYALGAVVVIAVSSLLGFLLAKTKVLPGTTAVWGLSPGAASVMTLMAESYGADAQLVGFMQYTRVIIVAGVASIVAKLVGVATQGGPSSDFLAPVDVPAFAATLALAVGGPWLAQRFNIRAGAMLIPLFAGVLLTHLGLMTIELPRWFLAAAYACIGWRIGLRFTKPLLYHAARALPAVLASAFALVALCGAFAATLVLAFGFDPLTAYLATSPGGADTVAIIAASTHVDKQFVMTMQMTRLIVVILVGPTVSRFIADRLGGVARKPVSVEPVSGEPV